MKDPNKKPIIIAIDGHSSTGKSTVARQLAKALSYKYIDTGAMYRAITYFALEKGLITATVVHKDALVDKLKDIEIRFDKNPETKFTEVFLNGENIEKKIRTLRVSKHVSVIAAISAVRRKLVEQQQEIGKDKGVVMDGRDIGTVVFPTAKLKLFMTATAKDRAERRFKELKENGEKVTYEQVLKNVVNRDHIDSTRKDSPLRQAKDAIRIDNSKMTLQEQYDHIWNLVQKALKEENTTSLEKK